MIEAYKKDVDRSLLRENLKLTPGERLGQLGGSCRRSRRCALPPAPGVADFGGLLRALALGGVEFIVVGGVAGAAHGR